MKSLSLRMFFASLLSVVLCFSAIPAQTQPQMQEAPQIAKIRQAVYKIGEGLDARVTITMRDKRKLKGWIRESTEDRLTLRNTEDGTTTELAYAEIASVKAPVRFSLPAPVIRGLIIAGSVGILAAIVATQSSRQSSPRPVVISSR